MNDKMVFGQYVNVDSWIHRLDPRTKIITLFSLMICLFLINNIYILLGLFAFELIIVISSKVPLNKFLNSFKMVSMLLVFTFFCQVLFNKSGQIVKIKDIELTGQFTLSIVSLLIGIILIVLYVFSKKMIKKFRSLLFIIIVGVIFYIQTINFHDYVFVNYTISVYDKALTTAFTVLITVINLLSLSALLTFCTKPTDLNSGIEGIFAPLKFMASQISIFAMMISIALRSIPTLLNESTKILKAQASRGVDFNEGTLKEKITQIISLLVPMLVISYKKAEDLAYAMEARGYIPGAKRTKYEILKYHLSDYLCYAFIILIIVAIIVLKIYKVI